jgi:hypothetical protein
MKYSMIKNLYVMYYHYLWSNKILHHMTKHKHSVKGKKYHAMT